MRRALVVVPLLLTFAGCTSADDASPSTSAAVTSPPTRATTASTVTESTDTAPNTTPTTTETTTSSVSTAAPDSNEPSTDTTIRPPTAEEQAVIDAVEASWQAWNNVLLDPTDDWRRGGSCALTDRARHSTASWRSVADLTGRERSLTSQTRSFLARIRSTQTSIAVDADDRVARSSIVRLDSNISVEIGGNRMEVTSCATTASARFWSERRSFSSTDDGWRSRVCQVARFEGGDRVRSVAA